MHSNYTPLAFTTGGSATAILGGLVDVAANTDPTNLSVIGIVGGILTGLGGVIVQVARLYFDAKANAKDIKDTRDQLDKSRVRWHDQANGMNRKMLQAMQANTDLKVKIATLEAQLGLTGKSHADAINANSSNVVAIAEQTGASLPVEVPHVDPVSGSGDDHDGFPSFLDPAI
jgi:hypothetical protein